MPALFFRKNKVRYEHRGYLTMIYKKISAAGRDISPDRTYITEQNQAFIRLPA